MTVEEWLGKENTLGIDIWTKKYQYAGESFDEWLDRVSGNDPEVRKIIEEKKFLPGGRILAHRGIPQNEVRSTLSNCYVLKTNDSIEDIYKTCADMARTYSTGGGVGVDISSLRPRGAIVHNSAKETTGAVSFMKTFDVVTETIGQSGRRGALMLSIDVRHPDVMEFVDIKRNTDQITHANISVRVNDDFMRAVKEDKDFILQWPCEENLNISDELKESIEYDTLVEIKRPGTKISGYIRKIKAKQLFMRLAENNWDYAEPGILYWDKISSWNMMSNDPNFEYAGVNPCKPKCAGL